MPLIGPGWRQPTGSRKGKPGAAGKPGRSAGALGKPDKGAGMSDSGTGVGTTILVAVYLKAGHSLENGSKYKIGSQSLRSNAALLK